MLTNMSVCAMWAGPNKKYVKTEASQTSAQV